MLSRLNIINNFHKRFITTTIDKVGIISLGINKPKQVLYNL